MCDYRLCHLRITIAYYAWVRMQEVKGEDDTADMRWFALDEVPQLAFDHDQIHIIIK